MASATGASFSFASCFSNYSTRRIITPSNFRPLHGRFIRSKHRSTLPLVRQCSISDTNQTPTLNVEHDEIGDDDLQKDGLAATLFMEEEEEGSLKDFFELAESLLRSDNGDGGTPRWFSPPGCSPDNCPLLLYLPGIVGTGAGLAMQQKRLGKVFEIRCMHIPATDRTPFTGLVSMVEETVKSESERRPNKPIYIVGESIGGCIALAVAAQNPDIDLVLILANPATSLDKSPIQSLAPLLEIMPDQVQFTHPFLLSLMSGNPFTALRATLELSADTIHHIISSYISILADILPKETLLWKLQMLRSASGYTNPLLHAVKAQTLLLISGKDPFLPNSASEITRLHSALPGCDVRKFDWNGHFLFLDDGVSLMKIIKETRFYRRGKNIDHVADYLPPTPSEFKYAYDSTKFISDITSPVFLSTLEDGTIVKGLAGLPSEGPTIYVGNHMLLGFEVVPLVIQPFLERNIHLRGMSHPILFVKYAEGVPQIDHWVADLLRIMGNVPVSGINFFKLLSYKANVLLYPGGAREALHRKGEEYNLFWPEEPEFVRMAARFGAKIVPFGVVGEDDLGEVVLDYDDLIKFPLFRDMVRDFTDQVAKLRTDSTGEVANQDLCVPGIMPKIPGRYYYFFGKAVETKGRKKELKDLEKSQELYMEVKSEVEKCIAYLKQKREEDPYRNIFSRLMYQTVKGLDSEVPTFEL